MNTNERPNSNPGDRERDATVENLEELASIERGLAELAAQDRSGLPAELRTRLADLWDLPELASLEARVDALAASEREQWTPAASERSTSEAAMAVRGELHLAGVEVRRDALRKVWWRSGALRLAAVVAIAAGAGVVLLRMNAHKSVSPSGETVVAEGSEKSQPGPIVPAPADDGASMQLAVAETQEESDEWLDETLDAALGDLAMEIDTALSDTQRINEALDEAAWFDTTDGATQ
jgi:hypothetical protein